MIHSPFPWRVSTQFASSVNADEPADGSDAGSALGGSEAEGPSLRIATDHNDLFKQETRYIWKSMSLCQGNLVLGETVADRCEGQSVKLSELLVPNTRDSPINPAGLRAYARTTFMR